MNNCGCQKQTVRMIFIRHGFSCANLQKESGFFGNIAKAFKYDPPLTNHAVRDIINKREEIQNAIGVKPDIVLASTLLRAQQTANFIYPNRPIFVAPFIKELGSTLDNIANEPSIQRKNDERAKKLYNEHEYVNGKKLGEKLDVQANTDYSFVLGKNSRDPIIRNLQVSRKEANEVDYVRFIVWLGDLAKAVQKPNRDVINIVVVGHSSFMAKHIQTLETSKKKKPRNVGVVEIFFCLRDEDTDGYGYLYEVDQNKCHCPGIRTLQDTKDNQHPWCNGVIYRGIDFPEMKDLTRFSSDNCNRI